MRFKFNFKDKEFLLDVEKCESVWSQFRGLMFRSDPKPLLFIFKRLTKMKIHSFFVNGKFLAIWLRNGQVIDGKVVYPWTLSVGPSGAFDCLIEIPFKSEQEISLFLDGSEKTL